MKSCPTCNRTYEDDTLVFCLDDGARLSAAYDARSTLPAPGAGTTDPPKTAILPPAMTATERSPIPAWTPVKYPQQTHQQTEPAQKRGGNLWVMLSGMFALLVLALITVLGYLAWKASNRPSPEPALASATAPANSNVITNANKAVETKPGDTAFRWLEGVWEGEGYQSDTRTTWAVKLTAHDASYAIEYPNIPCGGKWNLISQNSRGASFTEVITQGAGRCANNSHVIIEKVNDSEISCKYMHAHSRLVIATVVLSKKQQLTN